MLCLSGTVWEGTITIPGDMNGSYDPEQVENRLCKFEVDEQQQQPRHGHGSVSRGGWTRYPVKQAEMHPAQMSREGTSLVWQTEGSIGWKDKAKIVQYTCRGQLSSEPRWGIRGEVSVEGTTGSGFFEVWLAHGAAMVQAGHVAQAGCVIDDASMRPITATAIERLLEHMQRRMRLNRAIFKVKRPWGENMAFVDAVIERIEDVNLYDICQYVVKPACLQRESSMVEEISNQAATPDYFISQCGPCTLTCR
jgi:hypothetical protein